MYLYILEKSAATYFDLSTRFQGSEQIHETPHHVLISCKWLRQGPPASHNFFVRYSDLKTLAAFWERFRSEVSVFVLGKHSE